MIVTATRTEAPASQTGLSTTTFTAAEIERRQSPLVSELLRTSPGAMVLQTGGPGGVTSLFTARDLTNPKTYRSLGTVLEPSYECKSEVQCNPLTQGDACASYLGIVSVFPTQNDLIHLAAFYIADQKIFADERTCHKGSGFYGQLGLATSSDGGVHWQKHGPILSGEPLPSGRASLGPNGLNQPTVIKASGYYYAYLDYFASGQWPAGHPFRKGPQGLQVARAHVQADGFPGEWSKLYKGTFESGQSGMNGYGDNVIPEAGGPHIGSMAWISFNVYLKKYLLTFVAKDGWYYSTLPEADLDKQDWSVPQKFLSVPGGSNWVKGQPTWENMVFVTPGLPDNHETGQEGLVIFSSMAAWAESVPGKPRDFAVGRYRFGPDDLPPLLPPNPRINCGTSCK